LALSWFSLSLEWKLGSKKSSFFFGGGGSICSECAII
jgi:hypothetical protein